jgi:hypothetical protein
MSTVQQCPTAAALLTYVCDYRVTAQQHATDKTALDGDVWEAQRLGSTVLVEHSPDKLRVGPTEVLDKAFQASKATFIIRRRRLTELSRYVLVHATTISFLT